MRLLSFVPLLFLLLISAGCRKPKEDMTRIQFIPYSATVYTPTKAEDVRILRSRLEAEGKFVEIGVLKVEGAAGPEKILEEAAQKGADAIVWEKNNFTLLRYLERNKNGDSRES